MVRTRLDSRTTACASDLATELHRQYGVIYTGVIGILLSNIII